MVDQLLMEGITVLKKKKKKLKFFLGWLESPEHHIRCFAHIINLAVKDGLEVIKVNISNLRGNLKLVRASNFLLEQLKIECGLASVPYVKPILDCDTRWNSLSDAIEVALTLEEPLKKVFTHKKALVKKKI